jgi:hypothetical protein
MKHTSTFVAAALLMINCGAVSARSIRADTNPNAFGGGWSQFDPSTGWVSFPLLSGINPGVSGTPEVAVLLNTAVGFDEISAPTATVTIPPSGNNQVPLQVSQALSYDWPNRSATTAQVQVYQLDNQPNDTRDIVSTPSGGVVNIGGDTEVEFNYSSSAQPGVASFIYDGVKYQSAVPGALVSQTNDFFFNSAGNLLGWVNGSREFIGGLSNSGWTTAPASAPEVDPASGLSALTLLAGGLAIVRARRRLEGSAAC